MILGTDVMLQQATMVVLQIEINMKTWMSLKQLLVLISLTEFIDTKNAFDFKSFFFLDKLS